MPLRLLGISDSHVRQEARTLGESTAFIDNYDNNRQCNCEFKNHQLTEQTQLGPNKITTTMELHKRKNKKEHQHSTASSTEVSIEIHMQDEHLTTSKESEKKDKKNGKHKIVFKKSEETKDEKKQALKGKIFNTSQSHTEYNAGGFNNRTEKSTTATERLKLQTKNATSSAKEFGQEVKNTVTSKAGAIASATPANAKKVAVKIDTAASAAYSSTKHAISDKVSSAKKTAESGLHTVERAAKGAKNKASSGFHNVETAMKTVRQNGFKIVDEIDGAVGKAVARSDELLHPTSLQHLIDSERLVFKGKLYYFIKSLFKCISVNFIITIIIIFYFLIIYCCCCCWYYYYYYY